MQTPQATTPLLTALQELANKPDAAFYAPGHKRGVGVSPQLRDVLGEQVFRADLPELPELDNLFAPCGAIADAQNLAAEAFGAERTWFLVNGSTCGVMAAILATCGEGDKMILPRNVHQSAIAGLILSGAIPIFVTPEYDPNLDLAHSITPNAIANALQVHPDAKAVMLVYPTYYGACGDVGAIAQICHQHGIPLLVDEAHGPHFAFHPDLPPSALASGADLAVQSAHKVLGAMTQASMLHLQGQRIDCDRISQALRLLQSTSPSYLLLASLDATRQQMALHGEALMSKTLELAKHGYAQIAQIPDLSVLQASHTPGFLALDPTRISVNLGHLGISGYEADEILRQQFGVTAELPSTQHLTFIISLGNTLADIEKMVNAFRQLTQTRKALSLPSQEQTVFSRWKEEFLFIHPSSFRLYPSLSPRQAFFAATERVPIERADERICAEMICPYPPGIPALMPGEEINLATLDYLHQVLNLGGSLTGCSDPTLKTIKVVKA
ncbi:aminotransferase class I/II-fold pyridoxal phosphate-dependent enzyme [Geitlerinema splendidum]|nr:aminotransferase class I/II-fold pyridoxal phosphate-dependent enzyme [Geitlerinema splendidum]